MKKFLFSLLIFCMVSITGNTQVSASGFTTRTSITYVCDPLINAGQDTVFVQLSFYEGSKFADCSGTMLRIASKDFAYKDIENIPGTGIYQFWCPPVIARTVTVYQLSRNNIPVKSGSFVINPRKIPRQG